MTLIEISLCSAASALILLSFIICCNKNKCTIATVTQPIIVDAPKYDAYEDCPPSYVHNSVPIYEDPTTINK